MWISITAEEKLRRRIRKVSHPHYGGGVTHKAGGKSSLNNKGLRRKTLIMANEMTPSEVYACQAWEDSDIWGDIHDNCTHEAPVTVDKEFWNRGHIGDCINTICNHKS